MLKSRGNHNPRDVVTTGSGSKLSSIYPLFTFSDFHLLCLLNKRSFTPLFAANITPPEKRLCKPKSSFLSPISTSAFSKRSLVLVYERGLFTFRCLFIIIIYVVFVYQMSLKMYSSDLSLIRTKLE